MDIDLERASDINTKLGQMEFPGGRGLSAEVDLAV